ncbi:MAG: TlpA disulfide reductase family protein [Acidobacteriota bacterium]
MKKSWYLIFLALPIIALSIFLLNPKSSSNGEGKKAMDFTLSDVEGNKFTLSQFNGNVVILNFFATWCKFCRMEIPHLVELYNQYKDKGLTVISISVDRNPHEVLKPFIQSYSINFPVLIGEENVVNEYFGGNQGIPFNVVIDKNGYIRKTYVGVREKSVFENDLKELSEEK